MSTVTNLAVDESEASLTDLLDRAERGEEVTIRRQGRPVARLVPVGTVHDPEKARQAVADLRTLRQQLEEAGVRPFTIEEIVALKHEGHKY
jgi:prevent-host-death family protein